MSAPKRQTDLQEDLHAAQHGGEKSVNRFLAACRPIAVAAIRQTLPHRYRDAVEDCAQNALIKLNRNLANIRDYARDYAIANYVYTVAKNEAIDFFRHERRRTAMSIDDDHFGDPTSRVADPTILTIPPQQVLERAEIGKIIAEVIRQIPNPTHRRILTSDLTDAVLEGAVTPAQRFAARQRLKRELHKWMRVHGTILTLLVALGAMALGVANWALGAHVGGRTDVPAIGATSFELARQCSLEDPCGPVARQCSPEDPCGPIARQCSPEDPCGPIARQCSPEDPCVPVAGEC